MIKILILYFAIVFTSSQILDEKICEKSTTNNVKPTCPLTNAKLSYLIDNFELFMNRTGCKYNNETCARKWLDELDYVYGKTLEKRQFLRFKLTTDITPENTKLLDEFSPLLDRLNEIILKNGKMFYNNSLFWSPDIRRMLYVTRNIYVSDPKVVETSNKMLEIWSTATVCRRLINKTQCLQYEPGITTLLAKSRDYDELLWGWEGFHGSTGPRLRPLFVEYVKAQNKYARNNGYKDMSEMWIEELETTNFEKLYDDLYEQIKPLYVELHAYLRRKLRDYYGKDKINSSYIPAHILGEIFGVDWENINEIVKPYPNASSYNLTGTLLAQNYTVNKMFKVGENFYKSIGLFPLPILFWEYSMLKKPTNKKVVCHATPTDFFNGYDFRLRMCTRVTGSDFITVHHELGHVEYMLSYAKQPVVFRKGANSAFHEAIGDTISLSVLTEEHLKSVGLLTNYTKSNESDINTLLLMALSKVAFLPFGYLLDKWRWNVFRGNITPNDYNEKWWQMVNKYQGINSVVKRNETYFDPGAKYHVAADVPYARYFIAGILQFQFYKALCVLANHTGPLHTCDYGGSLAAGSKFKEMLSLGASKHWTYDLKLLTGESNVNAKAILEYFEPLMEWLKKENAKYPNDPVGW